MENDRAAALAAGFGEHVVKPVNRRNCREQWTRSGYSVSVIDESGREEVWMLAIAKGTGPISMATYSSAS